MRMLLPIGPVLRVVSASQSEELALHKSIPSKLRSIFNALVNRPGPLPMSANFFSPDFALRSAGGDVSVVAPWGSYALQDRELISGQNPFSDQALLKLLLPALDAKKKVVSAA